MKADIISDLNELIHRKVCKDRKAQSQFRTRMTRIGRISTDIANPRASAQSAFHHVCSSLKNPVSDTEVSAFIRVHPRFFKHGIFQTGLTGCVFTHVYPVILSNLKCQPQATWLSAMVREGTD
jgi:hypothetical protein